MVSLWWYNKHQLYHLSTLAYKHKKKKKLENTVKNCYLVDQPFTVFNNNNNDDNNNYNVLSL